MSEPSRRNRYTSLWNESLVTQLRSLWAEGVPSLTISKRLGVSRPALLRKAHRLQLPLHPSWIRWSKEEAAHLRRWWLEGVSCRVIAQRLGKTRNAIIAKADRLDLPQHSNSTAPREPQADVGYFLR